MLINLDSEGRQNLARTVRLSLLSSGLGRGGRVA